MSPPDPTHVTTDRLLLRPFEDADKDAYAAIRLDPLTSRFLSDFGADQIAARARTDASVETFAAAWQRSYGPWALVEQSSQSLVGHLGLRFLPDLQETEILYMLHHRFWGKGYATEAGHAALAFGFADLHLKTIIAVAKPENRASIAVMKRLGMRRLPGLHRAFGFNVVRCEIEAASYRDPSLE